MSYTAKSIILDIADNHGDPSNMGLWSIEFKLAGVLIEVSVANVVCYSTTNIGLHLPEYAFHTGLNKDGHSPYDSWRGSATTNQRLIGVFSSPITFDEVVINNWHYDGSFTTLGANNVKIYTSSDAITSPVYDEAIANSEVIFNGLFSEHGPINAADDEVLVLGGPPIEFISTGALSLTGVLNIVSALPPFEATGSLAIGLAGMLSFSDPAILFFFTLTGGPNGLTDVEIPIESFQARHRSGKPTYLAVTIPDPSYSSEISTRPNGQLVVRMAKVNQGAIYHSEEILRVNLEEIRPDGGGRNKSITLSGHSTETFIAKIVALQGVTFRTGSVGKRRFRLAIPDIFLRPGDTATYEGESILVDSITYSVSPRLQMMEIAE